MRWLLWLIPLYLIGLVAFAPAQLLVWGQQWFAPNQGGQPLVSNVSGTIWSGQAGTVAIPLPTGATLELRNVQWRGSPSDLIRGRISLKIDIPQALNVFYGDLQLVLEGEGLPLLKGQLRGDIDSTLKSVNAPMLVQVDGQWQLAIKDYALSDLNNPRWCDRLQADLLTSNMVINLNQNWRDLGDYQAQASCNAQQGIDLKIPNNNILGLQLDAQISGARQLPRGQVNGSFLPTLQAPKEVTDLLPLVGQPDVNGRYRFAFSW